MIARHCDLREILESLCSQAGENPEERQIAFFLLDGEHWQLAASGDLTAPSIAVLSAIVAEEVSRTLFDSGHACFDGFEARQLSSGIGEVLGLFVCFNPSPSCYGTADAVCRLAELAIEHHNLLSEMRWKADHDAVTGLLTRTAFERLLSERLSACGGHEPAALLCINLDRFHLINGVLGHSFGSRVLKCVGMRFQSCLNAGAALARLGGDEFAVLTTESDAVAVADELGAALARPFEIDEHQIFIGASIGIGSFRPGSSPELLQREAYIALYHAKRTRKGRWLKFQPSMAATPPERLEMEQCLRSALAKNEMELYYQPQIELATGALCGAEALLRWNTEGLGRISPSAFIPILEETGLIVEVGVWVLRQACKQGIEWHRQTGEWLRMAVNISTVQLRDPGFAQSVQRVLAETGFPHQFLELELTETIFVGDFERIRKVFASLQSAGVQIAIDDFGTGQASLSYLQNLPFQRLKIDRSFIAAIVNGKKCPPLVENIIQMAASLGMKSVAEGIERLSQWDVLRSAGCDEGQGYFFGHPLPPDEFLLLQRGRGFTE